jgi:translation initiation factor IF-1
MVKEEAIEVKGKVLQDMSHGTYKVELENKHQILAHPCGKMRKYSIKILPSSCPDLACRFCFHIQICFLVRSLVSILNLSLRVSWQTWPIPHAHTKGKLRLFLI